MFEGTEINFTKDFEEEIMNKNTEEFSYKEKIEFEPLNKDGVVEEPNMATQQLAPGAENEPGPFRAEEIEELFSEIVGVDSTSSKLTELLSVTLVLLVSNKLPKLKSNT